MGEHPKTYNNNNTTATQRNKYGHLVVDVAEGKLRKKPPLNENTGLSITRGARIVLAKVIKYNPQCKNKGRQPEQRKDVNNMAAKETE